MHLTLHLGTACNMACDYCYSPPKAGPAMSLETGQRALDFGARQSEGSTGIVFFGGEPLLHQPLIRELVSYGRRLESKGEGSFHFKVTTNGLLLDDEFLRYSVEAGILVAMSFDGVRAAHERHRRAASGASTYEVLLSRLQRLLELRPYAPVLMVVNPDTVPFYADSIRFLVEMGCRYLIVSPNYEAAWTEADLRALRGQLSELGELYLQWTREERKFYFSPFEVKISSHVNAHCYRKERCELAQRQLSVDPEGMLFPCVQFTKEGQGSRWCIGSLEQGIDETRRAALYADSDARKDPCRDCALEKRCNNTCGCLNWQSTGSLREGFSCAVPVRADDDGRRRSRGQDALQGAQRPVPAQALQRRVPGAVAARGPGGGGELVVRDRSFLHMSPRIHRRSRRRAPSTDRQI